MESFVYIMTNQTHGVLYTGVTSDLKRRAWQHREGSVPGFTSKYKVKELVYYEAFGDIRYAIEREKQVKKGSRQKKMDLIASMNPEWRDLYDDL
ncbi:MAG: GIY-YIG nuclease family protein [candidate division Zixibacteria bacterium]|nr:GIY-YIG nuclease family protein [candidate division Zixibacteria bacterium]